MILHWSKSRHLDYISCERKFFYGAIASNVNDEIRKLKNIEAPPLIRHEVVRKAIFDLISSKADVETVISFSKKAIEQLLTDDYDIDQQQAIAEECIASFFNNLMDEVASSNFQLVNDTKPISFIYGDIVIMTLPELIIDKDDHIEMFSWRTGTSTYRDQTDISFKTFALTAWANSVLNVEKDIKVTDVYLREDCNMISQSLDEDEMNKLYRKAQDVSIKYSSSGKVSDFRANPNTHNCKFCMYSQICKEYNEFFENSYDIKHIDDILTSIRNVDAIRRSFFISHSSRDKDEFIIPLVQRIDAEGFTYWYDDNEVLWGDNLIEEINQGLILSDYIIVCFSENYFDAKWADKELYAKIMDQFEENNKVILPLMLGDSKALLKKAPLISSLKHIKWEKGLDYIMESLRARIGKDS